MNDSISYSLDRNRFYVIHLQEFDNRISVMPSAVIKFIGDLDCNDGELLIFSHQGFQLIPNWVGNENSRDVDGSFNHVSQWYFLDCAFVTFNQIDIFQKLHSRKYSHKQIANVREAILPLVRLYRGGLA